MTGAPCPVTGARQRELLALLLLDAGHVVSSDRLMEELWGANQPAAGATALRVRVSQLRKALRAGGDVLVTRPPGYALLVPRDGLDLWRFERGLDEGERALASRPAARPRRALAGARGVARASAGRRRLRAVRAGRRRAPGGAARVGARAAHRGRAGARPPRAPDRRAAGPHERAPAARAALGAADDGALPRRAPGRRAGGVPDRPRAARRGDRHRARARAEGPRGADPRAGSRPRPPA